MRVLPVIFQISAWAFAPAALIGVSWVLADTYCHMYHRLPTKQLRFQHLKEPDAGEFVIDRAINILTPLTVAYTYFQQELPTRILLSGPGGNQAGAVVSGFFLGLTRLPAYVPPNTVCASSCVRILISVREWEVDPEAYLLFHAGRKEIPPYDDCQPCRFIKAHWPNGPTPTTTRHVMFEWANEISPKVEAFLRSCKSNPLDTYEGIALSGTQLKAIVDNAASYTCDDVRHQDINWLIRNGHVGQLIEAS